MSENNEGYSAQEIIENIFGDGSIEGLKDAMNYRYRARPLADGTIPKWLENEPSKPEQGKVPDPITNITEINNQIQQNLSFVSNNKIYEDNSQIYQTNTFNNTTINQTQNIVQIVPSKPSSLLKVEDGQEVDDQSPTAITIGAPITLAQSIVNQRFGQMMFNPFSDKKQVVRQLGEVDLGEKLAELNEAGIERFIAYQNKEEETTVLDSMVLLTPIHLRGTEGATIPLFGKEALKFYFANNSAASANALIGVSDIIPNGYEVETYTPEAIAPVSDLKNFYLKSEDNWLDLGEMPEDGRDWEEWLKTAVNGQYDDENNRRNKTLASNFSDFIRNALAPFFYRAGLNDLPFELPKHLAQDIPQGQEGEMVSTGKLSNYLLWQVQAFDSVIGQFPVKLRIEDTDLIKTGNQTLELKFPNLAEMMTELMGLALSNQTNNDVLLRQGIIELGELAQIKQQTVQNYYLNTAAQEYLGYKTKQVNKEVDFLFNPAMLGEEEADHSLEKFLQPGKLPVVIESNDDDDTLEKHMFALIEAARIIKAVHWRNVDLKGNPGKQIADTIKRAAKIADNLDAKEKLDLDEFLKDIETGFTNKLTNQDTVRPYGRSYGERPRIKTKLDNDTDTSDK